jgi:hypothetical protein
MTEAHNSDSTVQDTGATPPGRHLSSEERAVGGYLHLTKHAVLLLLGALWIIDAGLQFQPRMFGSDFVSMVIAPNAAGQPAPVAASITHMASFLSRDVALWNTVFGLAQLGIGLGILFRRTRRLALAASFVWVVGVWWFGEGFGGLLTGGANALTGAPGAVLLYAVIGLLVWPRDGASRSEPAEGGTGYASSAAATGPLGGNGGVGVWAALWVFFAVLQLLPQSRSAGWLHNVFTRMAAGQPGWYSHFLASLGHAFTGAGTPTAVLLAAAFLGIGLGPLVSRRGDLFILAGMALSVLFWVIGQGLGGILTGMGTDPSAGPLVVLLGAAVLPTVLDPVGSPVLFTRAFERHRPWATLGTIALIMVPVAVAVIPEASAGAVAHPSVATARSTSTSKASTPAVSGMSMSMGSAASGTGSSRPASSGKSMNMSAMAGLGVTDPKWKYTGPDLPASEVSLLTSVGNATDAGHAMQTPECTTAPTSDQVLGAVQYVQTTSAAVAKYKDLSVAVANGYRPITSTAYPIVHYLNYGYMNPGDILNPNAVDSLVYAFTPYGPVLVAAMYLLPSDANGPMPYGCLMQWHAHTNLCFSSVTHTVAGFAPCGPGEYKVGARTPYMTHVWQVPVSGGPLAIDPSDLQVMQAAIMAQQQGLAPTTTPVPPTAT